MSARYLIRFDDLCPTMNWHIWRQIEAMLLQYEIKPILAVIPDNKDEEFQIEAANPRFWDSVRTWQERGWSIGLHGYQHQYVTKNAGVIGLNPYSEFAGLSFEEQEVKIRRGLDIFRREGVRADLWIAPGHSFDRTTVAVLRQSGINTISDGLFPFPRRDSDGVRWIPQQMWRFRGVPFGVWTVCLHFNAWSDIDVIRLRQSIERYANYIVRLDQIIPGRESRGPGRIDDLTARLFVKAIHYKTYVQQRLAAH